MSGAFSKRHATPGARRAGRPSDGPAFARRKPAKPKGYFLGGLTSASPASSTSSYNQTSTTSYDPQYTDYFHNILNKSNDLYGTMKDKTADDAVAGFTPDQIAAQQGVRGNVGSYQPYFDKASGAYDAATTAAGNIGTAGAGAFANAQNSPGGSRAAQPYFDQASGRFTDPGVASSYMSPFLDQVAANTTRLSNQNLQENILPGVNDTFSGGTMGAQFGRERHADITGRAIRDQQNTLTGNLANIYNTGYQNAEGQYNADQSRLGTLGSSAGSLANSTIGAFGNLGSAQTSAAATGVSGQIGAGQAQAALGQGTQGAGYTDAAALGQSGATQQALQQQKDTFNLQYPWQLLGQQHDLGTGYQVGSTTNMQGTSTSSQTPASGSPLGSIVGAGLGIAGLGTSGGGTLGGNFLSGLFKAARGGAVPDRRPAYADGGPVGYYAAGGYAPLINDSRAMMQSRMPAMQQRFQAQQQPPGMPPGGQMPAFARGGAVKRHFADGGYTDGEYASMIARGGHSPFFDARQAPEGYFERPHPFSYDERQQADRAGRGFFDRLSDLPGEVYEGGKNFLADEYEGAKSAIANVPDALRQAYASYRRDPLGYAGRRLNEAAEFAYPWTPMGSYADMTDASREMFDPKSDWMDRGVAAGRMGLGVASAVPGVGTLSRMLGR